MEKKVTIYTLAEKLNMSVSAVSRAFTPNSKLNAEKRKIILEAAEKYGYVQNKMASRLSQNPFHIGVIMRGRIEAYYHQMTDGINAAFLEFKDYKVSYDLRNYKPGEFTVEKACKTLDEFLEKKYDAVIVHGLYNQDMINKVNQLADAGIKVVTLHNDMTGTKRLFCSTTNIAIATSMVAQLFDILLPKNHRNIAVFTGSMQSPIHQGLVFNFSNHASRYGLNLIQPYDTLDIPDIAERLVEEAFATNAEINGIYISSANSIPICRFLEKHELGDKIAVIASDVFEELSEYIRKGIVKATIFQDPFAQGYNAFAKLYHYLAESEPVQPVVTTKPQIVLESNLSLYE